MGAIKVIIAVAAVPLIAAMFMLHDLSVRFGPTEEWRPWFAWRPVPIDGRRVWLRKIERRTVIFRTRDQYRLLP